AESWEAIDTTTWAFELREGVTFHDGTALTPDAVAFTVERIVDEATESPIRGGFTFIESVEITGDASFRIHTERPMPLAEHYFSELLIVPPHAFADEAAADRFARNPIGTGPFRFESWQRDVQLRLSAFEDHWRGAPAIDALTFRPAPEAITRVSALQAGEAQIVTQVPPSLAPVLEAASGVSLAAVDGARAIYVGINSVAGHEALQDPRVRRALNLAVDVDAIIDGILDGRGTPTTTFLTEVDFGYDPAYSPFPYDPDAARELLDEAGWAEGLSVTLQSPNGRYVGDAAVAQAVAEQLSAVGIDVNLEIREYGAYVGDLFSGNAPDLYLIGWGNAPLDADFILPSLLRTDELLSYTSDPELDALLDAGRSTVDRGERQEAYSDALALMSERAHALFLYKPQDLYGVSDDVAWTPRTDERLWMFDAQPR
ncbi:MAG: ABC transporter substrate-binding protein, partial [Trueperaceae bacterium]